jgi:hypothetical protein
MANSVTSVPMLANLQGPWAELRVELVGPAPAAAAAGPVMLPDIYPFTSVTELKRRIWLHQGGDPRWSPERVFLGVRSTEDPTRIRPLEFYWPTAAELTLPDPTVAARTPSPLLVDDAGNRKPVTPTMIGTFLLEGVLNPRVETVTAFSLTSIAGDITPEQLTPALYAGFFQLYFPWLTAPAQVLDAGSTVATAADRAAYAVTVPYLEDRTGRIGIVERALGRGVAGASASMTTMVRLRWLLPAPVARPESLEKTFYGLTATPTIPFLRYFPAEGTGSPLLKLALHPDGNPVIADPKILAAYLQQPAPNTKSGVILARVPLHSAHAEPAAAFTLHMFEDGVADITFKVPQQGATYIATVASEAQRLLRDVMTAMGFPADANPDLRDLFATYKWTHPSPQTAAPITATRLRTRVAALTPFLEMMPLAAEETALAAFQWRAVSNYESETAQFAYVTQMVLRAEKEGPIAGDPAAAHAAYIEELSGKFGLTREQAGQLLDRWMERRGEAVAPGPGQAAGMKAVPAHATGARITVAGKHPEYSIEIHGASSYQELQRIVSVVGVLLGASMADLTLAPPSSAVALLSEAVAIQEASTTMAAATAGGTSSTVIPAEEEAGGANLGDLDPAYADLMADLGIDLMGGMGEEVEEAEALGAPAVALEVAEVEAAAATTTIPTATAGVVAAPDVAAAAAAEEECRANPWAAGEPALKVKPDWYMARLKKEDIVMFGFSATATGRVKSYSKSCQRRDDRQPNIMTFAEYSRIRRCYTDRVRFVDLPPRKPEDLPQDPTYTPRGRYPDEYFLTDPQTGRPMWTVYNYENKTTPGQFLYLMCAELWCERDNLPLLRSEFEGTEGRGFTKPVNTCPFCGGKPFADLEAPRPGESVIVRLPKEATGKLHAFVGTITRNKHPKGYPLPCCDTTPRMLKKYLNAAFNKTLVMGRDLAVVDEDEEEEGAGAAGAAAAEEPAEPPPELVAAEQMNMGVTAEEARIDYGQRLSAIRTQYILGADKALGPGKFGLLPPAGDAFFGQNGPASVESRGIRPTFKEGATLFVRLGVDTRTRAPGLNLFAGLAPLLGFESAEQTQRAFMSLRAAPAFESANYGTLLQEFAARPAPPAGRFEKSLAEFATEFGYPLDTARAHVLRVYRAWSAYLAYLNSVSEPKQLRHIEHMLAQPGVVTPRGLLLVVLEPEGDHVRVVCPSFGIPPASSFGDVPVAFVWHDRRDESWEPLILYNDSRGAGTRNAIMMFGERSLDLEALPRELRAQLSQWIRDWRSSSKGCGRGVPPPHVWTPAKDTAGLPRLRDLLVPPEGGPTPVKALVRDRSNRLVGVLAPVFVPCLDDGSLAADIPRVYEATMIPPTPLADMLRAYEGLAARFPSLRPTNTVALLSDEATIVGFRTAIGSLVPVTPEPFVAATPPPLPVQQIDKFPWEFDALLLRAPDAPVTAAISLEESVASVEEQLAEAYQHLRLSFSRWLQRDARGPPTRLEMDRIRASSLPLYERRKRMDLLLEPFLREMVAAIPAEAGARRPLSLLRQDCLSLPEGTCKTTGACSWSPEGRCLIHAPTPDAATDPIRIFTARLSDELLRYPGRRDEILRQEVPEIRTPRGVVRIGNELYMATRPKEVAASVLQRLGFTGEMEMTFPEEMLRFAGLEEEAAALAAEEAAAAAAAPGAGATVARIRDYADDRLPPSWTAAGFQLPAPAAGLPDPRGAAFAGVTGRSMEEWSTFIQRSRSPPDLTTPFNWSVRDMYFLATRLMANILYIRDGRIRLWIRPATPPAVTILFWGPQELLLSRGKNWRFKETELPADLLAAMDATTPMAVEAILASGDAPAAAAPSET